MKNAEFRGMGEEQLSLTLKETVKNLFHLRVQSATERLETPSQILKAKKEIARIKTIQREQSLLKALLAQLPTAEAERIRGIKEPEKRLPTAQAALKTAPKEKK